MYEGISSPKRLAPAEALQAETSAKIHALANNPIVIDLGIRETDTPGEIKKIWNAADSNAVQGDNVDLRDVLANRYGEPAMREFDNLMGELGVNINEPLRPDHLTYSHI